MSLETGIATSIGSLLIFIVALFYFILKLFDNFNARDEKREDEIDQLRQKVFSLATDLTALRHSLTVVSAEKEMWKKRAIYWRSRCK